MAETEESVVIDAIVVGGRVTLKHEARSVVSASSSSSNERKHSCFSRKSSTGSG